MGTVTVEALVELDYETDDNFTTLDAFEYVDTVLSDHMGLVVSDMWMQSDNRKWLRRQIHQAFTRGFVVGMSIALAFVAIGMVISAWGARNI